MSCVSFICKMREAIFSARSGVSLAMHSFTMKTVGMISRFSGMVSVNWMVALGMGWPSSLRTTSK